MNKKCSKSKVGSRNTTYLYLVKFFSGENFTAIVHKLYYAQ